MLRLVFYLLQQHRHHSLTTSIHCQHKVPLEVWGPQDTTVTQQELDTVQRLLTDSVKLPFPVLPQQISQRAEDYGIAFNEMPGISEGHATIVEPSSCQWPPPWSGERHSTMVLHTAYCIRSGPPLLHGSEMSKIRVINCQ